MPEVKWETLTEVQAEFEKIGIKELAGPKGEALYRLWKLKLAMQQTRMLSLVCVRLNELNKGKEENK